MLQIMPKRLWNRSWSSLWRLLGFFRHVNDRGLGGGTMDGPLRRVIDAPIQGGPRDWLRLHTHVHKREREKEILWEPVCIIIQRMSCHTFFRVFFFFISEFFSGWNLNLKFWYLQVVVLIGLVGVRVWRHSSTYTEDPSVNLASL